MGAFVNPMDLKAMASNLINRNGLHPRSDGPLIAMASNLKATIVQPSGFGSHVQHFLFELPRLCFLGRVWSLHRAARDLAQQRLGRLLTKL